MFFYYLCGELTRLFLMATTTVTSC